jgi:hypothetical protein
MAERATKRAGGKAGRPREPATLVAKSRLQRKGGGAGGKSWLLHINLDERKVMNAVLPSYPRYKRLRQRPEECDAWLAQDDKQGSRRGVRLITRRLEGISTSQASRVEKKGRTGGS